jgi:hypothetical protein
MTISQEFAANNLVYDRYLGEELALPYSYDYIKVQPNDTVSEGLINLKLSHLHENMLYLYKNTLVSSNLIPVSGTAIAGVTASSTNFTWYRNLSTSQFISISSNPQNVGVDKTNLMVTIKNTGAGLYYAFLAYQNKIKVFKFDEAATYLQNVYTINEIDPGTSNTDGYNVNYINLTGFATIDYFLYVLDAERNQLIKYDATGFFITNNILNERLVYVDSIGNYGEKESKAEFKSPTGLASYNKYLFVLDAGNSCVKKYDKDLNWQYTYRLSKDLLNLNALDIACDSEGNIFILTNTKIIKYNNTFTTKQEFLHEVFNESGEIFKKIVISQTDNNIFYLISNKNVYKKFATRPEPTVGKYLLYLYKYDLPFDSINAFSVNKHSQGDIILLFSFYNNTGKLGYFVDNLNLYDILAQRDFDIYNLDNILLNGDEYLQNWVLNKNISKILINHMRFRDQIIGKFLARQDDKGNIVFKGTRYLLPNELESIYFGQDLNAYIGANELVTCNIVNRVLSYIYNIQTNILNILKSEILDIPSLDIQINLN